MALSLEEAVKGTRGPAPQECPADAQPVSAQGRQLLFTPLRLDDKSEYEPNVDHTFCTKDVRSVAMFQLCSRNTDHGEGPAEPLLGKELICPEHPKMTFSGHSHGAEALDFYQELAERGFRCAGPCRTQSGAPPLYEGSPSAGGRSRERFEI